MALDITALANHLRSARHRYLGISPSRLDPPNAPPCASLGQERSMQAIDFALQAAANYWPEAQDWALIGGNIEEQRGQEQLPPGFTRLQEPDELMTFGGTA